VLLICVPVGGVGSVGGGSVGGGGGTLIIGLFTKIVSPKLGGTVVVFDVLQALPTLVILVPPVKIPVPVWTAYGNGF
jgi:hypothetical protein